VNRFRQGNKDGVTGFSSIAGVQFFAPLFEEGQRLFTVAYFVAKIVGDSAVGINGMKVRTKLLGKEPARDMKVLVMSAVELVIVLTDSIVTLLLRAESQS
jgi:hypothetical protein